MKIVSNLVFALAAYSFSVVRRGFANDFDIGKMIGEGTFGTVHLGKSKVSGNQVVLKGNWFSLTASTKKQSQ